MDKIAASQGKVKMEIRAGNCGSRKEETSQNKVPAYGIIPPQEFLIRIKVFELAPVGKIFGDSDCCRVRFISLKPQINYLFMTQDQTA